MRRPLRQVIYVSDSSDEISQLDIDNIVDQSRTFNQDNNITGLLVTIHNHFYQLLEGPQESVLALYAKIKQDSRHKNVRTIVNKNIDIKSLPSWDILNVINISDQADAYCILKDFARHQECFVNQDNGIFHILVGLSDRY